MKKLIAIAAALAVFLFVTGCSTADSGSAETEAAESAVRTVLPEDEPAPLYLIEDEQTDNAEEISPDTEAEPEAEPKTEAAEPEPTAEPDPEPEPAVEPAPEPAPPEEAADSSDSETEYTYVLNTNSKKIHYADCSGVKSMNESNKAYTNDYEGAVTEGYEPCGICKPKG